MFLDFLTEGGTYGDIIPTHYESLVLDFLYDEDFDRLRTIIKTQRDWYNKQEQPAFISKYPEIAFSSSLWTISDTKEKIVSLRGGEVFWDPVSAMYKREEHIPFIELSIKFWNEEIAPLLSTYPPFSLEAIFKYTENYLDDFMRSMERREMYFSVKVINGLCYCLNFEKDYHPGLTYLGSNNHLEEARNTLYKIDELLTSGDKDVAAYITEHLKKMLSR